MTSRLEKILNTESLNELKKNSSKIYGTDTNILINDPYALFYLSGNAVPQELHEKIPGAETQVSDPNNIVISEITIYELDHIKGDKRKDPWVRWQANMAIEVINYIREKGYEKRENPYKGISMKNGAKFFIIPHNEIEFKEAAKTLYEPMIDQDLRIIYGFKKLKEFLEKNKVKKRVILVSDDKNMKNKLDLILSQINIEIQEYEKDRIGDYNKIYSGKIEIEINSEKLLKKYVIDQMDLLKKALKGELLKPKITLEEFARDFNLDINKLYPNEIIIYKISQELKEKYKLTNPENIKKGYGNDKDSIFNLLYTYNRISPDKKWVYPLIKTAIYSKEIQEEFPKLELKVRYNDENPEEGKKLINKVKSSLNKLAKKGKVSIEDVVFTIEKEKEKFLIKSFGNIKENLEEKFSEFATALFSKYPFYKYIIPNYIQLPMFELLLDENITTVSIIGEQGAGKSLLALLAGLYFVYKGYVEKISIIRSAKELGGESFGYLPGSESDKMAPWKRSVWDNLIEIFTSPDASVMQREEIKKFIEDLEKKYEIIEFLAPQFLQGRTLHRRYIIVDEAQNFPRPIIRIIQGRVGRNSKIVYLGDPKQLGAVGNINRKNSGIWHLPNKLRHSEYNYTYAHITLPEYFTDRSEASKLSNDI